jgi:hypothetical protein
VVADPDRKNIENIGRKCRPSQVGRKNTILWLDRGFCSMIATCGIRNFRPNLSLTDEIP